VAVTALLGGADDHAMDKQRGDVGSWVREAAMEGLATAVTVMVDADVRLGLHGVCVCVCVCVCAWCGVVCARGVYIVVYVRVYM